MPYGVAQYIHENRMKCSETSASCHHTSAYETGIQVIKLKTRGWKHGIQSQYNQEESNTLIKQVSVVMLPCARSHLLLCVFIQD
ncbi:hypothetical protein Q5P01_012390 [Channa striata]|uniref:Uncharacterized protein n=1 Tax=Channa striata TaxID=64152 RepID=A0AA88MPS8_CHASR|nr:hypothetical protein Q5P01_012390 [Channa striata]